MESFEVGYASTVEKAIEEAKLKAIEENGESHNIIVAVDMVQKVPGGYKANLRITSAGGDESQLEVLAHSVHDIELLAMACGCDLGKVSSMIMAEQHKEELIHEAERDFFSATHSGTHVDDVPYSGHEVPDIHDVIGKSITLPHPEPSFGKVA